MPGPNTQFELSVEDMDLIETALRNSKNSLSQRLIKAKAGDDTLKETLQGIHDLLGRLHNQKEFYRPKSSAYVSG